jgi:hypothetical protein
MAIIGAPAQGRFRCLERWGLAAVPNRAEIRAWKSAVQQPLISLTVAVVRDDELRRCCVGGGEALALHVRRVFCGLSAETVNGASLARKAGGSRDRRCGGVRLWWPLSRAAAGGTEQGGVRRRKAEDGREGLAAVPLMSEMVLRNPDTPPAILAIWPVWRYDKENTSN